MFPPSSSVADPTRLRGARAVLVFVKWPEPGRVKTRLAAAVGAEEAAAIYRRLVRAMVGQLPAEAEWVAVFDPPEQRAEVAGWLAAECPGRAWHFEPQARGDLGARLEQAFARAFAVGCERVAVVGSDCVELTPALFAATWRALDAHDAVLGPTHDGGYFLLALQRPAPELFREIAWSTPAVFPQTLARAAAAGLRVHLLPPLHDVDTADDWRRAEAGLPPDRSDPAL